MKTLIVAMVAAMATGCVGRGLEAGGETASTFAAVESIVRSDCMQCHKDGESLIGVFSFTGTDSADYSILQQYATDGGSGLMAKLEHHGAMSEKQIEAWRAWFATGMEP